MLPTTFCLQETFGMELWDVFVPFDIEWFWVQVRGPAFEQQILSGWKPSVNSFLAQSAAEMSKGTYRLLTLQIFDTVLLFAGSVIYVAYSWVTRTSDCQIKVSRSRGDMLIECVPSDLISGLLVLSVCASVKYWNSTLKKAVTASSHLARSSSRATWSFNALYMHSPRYIETT